MKASGHVVEAAMFGKCRGLRCSRCTNFNSDANFDQWAKVCKPKPIPRQLLQHQLRRRREIETAQMAGLVKRAKAEDERREAEAMPVSRELVQPTGADDEDASDINEGRPVKRSKQAEKEKWEPALERSIENQFFLNELFSYERCLDLSPIFPRSPTPDLFAAAGMDGGAKLGADRTPKDTQACSENPKLISVAEENKSPEVPGEQADDVEGETLFGDSDQTDA